jgi:hypothetical protein
MRPDDDLDAALRTWAAEAGQDSRPAPLPAELFRVQRRHHHWPLLGVVAATVLIAVGTVAISTRSTSHRAEDNTSATNSARPGPPAPVMPAHSGAVYASPPVGTPEPGRCALPSEPFTAKRPTALVTVDPDPSAVTAIWYPGLNTPSADCTASVAQVGTKLARTLAADIRSAQPVKNGRYNCPADLARGVVLYFTYPDRAQAQTVTVSVSGCSWITAHDRLARWTIPRSNPADHSTGAILSDLAALRPQSFK